MSIQWPNIGLYGEFEKCEIALEKLNDNFKTLDSLSQISIEEQVVSLPASGSTGDRVILNPSGDIYTFTDQWELLGVQEGYIAYDKNLSSVIYYDGTEWVIFSNQGQNQNIDNVGVGQNVFNGYSLNTAEFRRIEAAPNTPVTVGVGGQTIYIGSDAIINGENLVPSDASNFNVFEGNEFNKKLRFRSLKAGSGITLTENYDNITIDSTGGGTGPSTPNYNWRSLSAIAGVVQSDDVYLRGDATSLEFSDPLAVPGQTIYYIGDLPSTITDHNSNALVFDEDIVHSYFDDTHTGDVVPVYAFVAGVQGGAGNKWYQLSGQNIDFDNTTTNFNGATNGDAVDSVNYDVNLAYGTPTNTDYFNISGSTVTAKVAGLYNLDVALGLNYVGNISKGNIFANIILSNSAATGNNGPSGSHVIPELTGTTEYVNYFANKLQFSSPVFLNVGDTFKLRLLQTNSDALDLNIFTVSLAATKLR